MAFPTDRIQLSRPAYGRRPSTEMIVLHTTEGADSSSSAALATIKMQSPGGSLYAGGGSYNFIMTDDGPILTVPYLEAAGGLTGNHQQAAWAPQRNPWMQAFLSAAAYADPNAYALQIAVSGKTSSLMAYPRIQRIVDDTARLILWAEAQPEISNNLLVTGHMHWQTDRSDPGDKFLEAVMRRYADIKTVPAAPNNGAITDWAGRVNALGTKYPDYIHTDGQALAWLNRAIANLRAAHKAL